MSASVNFLSSSKWGVIIFKYKYSIINGIYKIAPFRRKRNRLSEEYMEGTRKVAQRKGRSHRIIGMRAMESETINSANGYNNCVPSADSVLKRKGSEAGQARNRATIYISGFLKSSGNDLINLPRPKDIRASTDNKTKNPVAMLAQTGMLKIGFDVKYAEIP